MQKTRPWWRVPVILSAVLGWVPATFTALGALYGRGDQVAGGLGVLFVVLVAIWLPALIVMGIRRLR